MKKNERLYQEGQKNERLYQEDPEKKEPKHWIEHVMFIIALGTIAVIALYKC